MTAPFATALLGRKPGGKNKQADAWREVTGQRRVLSYALLLDTLASWRTRYPAAAA
jgi:hypothetical protein